MASSKEVNNNNSEKKVILLNYYYEFFFLNELNEQVIDYNLDISIKSVKKE